MTRTWKRALVTGASSGIGEAFATRLAAHGTDLVVVARRRDRLESLAGRLATSHSVEVEVLSADLANPEGVAEVVRRLDTRDAPVDLLVNNAGIGASGAFVPTPLETALGMVHLNVEALTVLSHAAAGAMAKRGRGGILNVSSVAGFTPGPGSAVYAATKAYVTAFSLGAAEELRDSGVRVIAVCPGMTRSEFHERGGYSTTGVPEAMWMTSDEVAAEGLAALASGAPVRVTGTVNKVLVALTGLVPTAAKARVVGAVSGRARGSGSG